MGQCISAMGLKDQIVSGRYGDSPKQLDSLVELIKVELLGPAERSRALKWSVQGNSNALVKLVLDMGVDVNHRDKSQRTALHHAVAGREPDSIASAMKRLEVELEACNDPSSMRSIVAQYNPKSTITRYDSQIILTLLQAGADVDLVDACGLSALMYAAFTGNLIGVTEILSRKPRIDGKDKDGYTTLIMAAILGHIEIAKALVTAGANLDVQDNHRNTALIWATSKGHTEIAKALVTAGANLDVQANHNGCTALMCAASDGHTEIAKALVTAGANLDVQVNDNGYTALIRAAGQGHTEIAKALVSAGANLDVQANNNGYRGTALIRAAGQGHTEIAKALVSAGANLDVQDNDGSTVLILAASKGHTEFTKALVSAGANLDVQDKDGNTALILAASDGHTEVTRALVTAGAQLNIRDKDGDTALICAVARSQPHTADVIVSSARPGTLDIDAVNSKGWTAVTWARDLGYHPLAEKMILYGARREMDRQPEASLRAPSGHAVEQSGQSSNLNNWQKTTQAIKVALNVRDILEQL